MPGVDTSAMIPHPPQFSLSGTTFPPAAALAATFIDSKGKAGAGGWQFVFFPSIFGNAVLWIFAMALSRVRQAVRIALATEQWRSSVPTSELATLFKKCASASLHQPSCTAAAITATAPPTHRLHTIYTPPTAPLPQRLRTARAP